MAPVGVVSEGLGRNLSRQPEALLQFEPAETTLAVRVVLLDSAVVVIDSRPREAAGRTVDRSGEPLFRESLQPERLIAPVFKRLVEDRQGGCCCAISGASRMGPDPWGSFDRFPLIDQVPFSIQGSPWREH
jgi:hypothetical protein